MLSYIVYQPNLCLSLYKHFPSPSQRKDFTSYMYESGILVILEGLDMMFIEGYSGTPLPLLTHIMMHTETLYNTIHVPHR